MYWEVIAVLFALSGFFMKFSDDAYDISQNKQFAAIIGIFCAVASAIATVLNADAACIFIGILIGNLIAFKVDGMHHIITLALFAVLVLIFGLPSISIVVLIICTVAALLDEVGHEKVSKKTSNKFVNLFFEYRFTMKVVILLLAIFQVFSIWIFVCFLLFEIAYVIAGICYEKLI